MEAIALFEQIQQVFDALKNLGATYLTSPWPTIYGIPPGGFGVGGINESRFLGIKTTISPNIVLDWFRYSVMVTDAHRKIAT